ncbi:MAG TPA: hypothetical protein VG838_08680 [Opitutaceae bacterium]|nr:hypothetical protein [Opitutaceae bacterium]
MIRFDLTAPMQSVSSAFDSLQTYVYSVAFLVTLLGYYVQVWRRRGEPAKTLEAFALTGLCVMFAASVSFWRPYVVNLFYFPAEQLARASSVFQLNLAINNFFHGMSNLVTDTATNSSGSTSTFQQVAQFMWNFSEITKAALLGASIQLLVDVLTIIGAFIALPFYFLQHVLVVVFFSFMPIAICGLTVPAFRDKAVAYMSMTASVLAWPLGFSIVAAATNTVFQIPFTPDGGVAGGVAIILEPLLKELVAAVIMIFGTLLVPPTMLFIFLYGGTHIDPIMSAARSIPVLGGLARR